MKAIKTILVLYTTIMLAACSFGTEPEIDDSSTPSGVFLSSIDIEAGNLSASGAAGSAGFGAAAAVPHWDGDSGVTIADGESGTLPDWPMVGQVTNYSVTEVEPGLFRVVSVTTYPYNAHLDNTREIYFLKDLGSELALNARYQFTDRDGNPNSLFREEYSTTFTGDFAVYSRDEVITRDSNTNPELLTGDPGYSFRSTVEYVVRGPIEDLGTLRLEGTREYFNIDDVNERIVVTESGRITNMNWNGRIYRGNTQLEGKIILHIVDRELVNQEITYTLTHRDLREPIVFTR